MPQPHDPGREGDSEHERCRFVANTAELDSRFLVLIATGMLAIGALGANIGDYQGAQILEAFGVSGAFFAAAAAIVVALRDKGYDGEHPLPTAVRRLGTLAVLTVAAVLVLGVVAL